MPEADDAAGPARPVRRQGSERVAERRAQPGAERVASATRSGQRAGQVPAHPVAASAGRPTPAAPPATPAPPAPRVPATPAVPAVLVPTHPVDGVAVGDRAGRPSSRQPLDRRLLVLALIAGIFFGGLSALYVHSRPARYESTSVLLIDQSAAIAASGDEGVLAKLSRLRFKYAGIVRTDVFSDPVAQTTGLPVGEVRSSLFAATDPNSLLLFVGARPSKEADARPLAQAAAEQLVQYANTEQANAGIQTARRVTLTIASPASTPQRVGSSGGRAALVGLVVLLAVVTAGVLGADLLRRRPA